MKKNKSLCLLFVFTFFLGLLTVNAQCSTSEKNALKKEAYKIELDYKIDDVVDIYRYYHISVEAVNMNANMYLTNAYDENFFWKEENLINQAIPLGLYENGEKVVFRIYSSSKTACPDTLLHTKTINLPYYNDYALREECKGLEDFALCQRWYDNRKIDTEEKFLAAIEEFKAGKIAPTPVETKEESKTLIDYLKDNIIVISVLVAVLIIALVYKFRKKEKKIKIKALKLFLIFLAVFTFFNYTKVSAGGSAIGGIGIGSGAPYNPNWDATHTYNSFGIRLSLYRYDGTTLTSYGSVDLAHNGNHTFNSATAGGYGKLDYTQLSKTLVFNKTKYGKGKTDSSLKNIYIRSGKQLKTNNLKDKITTRFNLKENPEAIASSVKSFFNVSSGIGGSDVYDLYITVEPTMELNIKSTVCSNSGHGCSPLKKYGTVYELNQGYFHWLKNSSGLGNSARNSYGNLIYAKYNQEHGDRHNFVASTGNYLIRNVGSSAADNGYQINSDPRSGYGIGVFWLAGELKTCKSVCHGKTGDALLACAEAYCQASHVGEGVSKGSCIEKCDYKVNPLKCPTTTKLKAKNTVCSASSTAENNSCSIIKSNSGGTSYSYKMDCSVATTLKYPDLPAAVAAGQGFEYKVLVSGSKNCEVTFDLERWKFDYAASTTDAQRTSHLNVLKAFNDINWNSQTYDSKNSKLNLSLEEILRSSTKKRNIDLVVEDKYQFGSTAVFKEAKSTRNAYSYRNGVKVVAPTQVSTVRTTSNNSVYHKLPAVCLSYKKSGEILNAVNGSCNAIGNGPYHKIYSDFNAKDNAVNPTKVTITDNNNSGYDAINTCSYITADVSCYLSVKSNSFKGGRLNKNVPITFELIIDGNRSLVKSHGVDGATRIANQKYIFTWPNFASNTTAYANVNGWIKTEDKTISCPFKAELTDDCPGCNCVFNPIVESGGTYSLSISKKDHSASAKYYISFNRGLDINNTNLRDYYERSSVSFAKASGVTSVYGYVVDNGKIHFGDACVLKIPIDNKSCITSCSSKDFDCIYNYCENNPTDNGRYSGKAECIAACSLQGTCRQLFACDELEEIKNYCNLNYTNEGYSSASACMNDCACYSKNYFYRPIDISDPFPNRAEGWNWFGLVHYITHDEDDPTSTGSLGGDAAEFVIDLNKKRILAIRRQSKLYDSKVDQNSYLDYVRSKTYNQPDYRSKFIHENDTANGGFKSYFSVINGKES